MKRIAIAAVCLFLLSTFAVAAEKPKADAKGATAAHEDTKFLLNYMKRTREDFLKSIKGLSPAQWTYKASPDRWSIAECAEHITLSEEFIRQMVQDKVMKMPAASEEERAKANLPDEELIKRITDRSKKAQAPEPLKPTNKWANAKEIETEFKKRREATIQYVKSTPESDLRAHVAPSPAGAPLDGFQFLELLSAHTKRHTLQIEEVKADPGYPKK
jgi:hypothetical protein